MNDVLDFKSLLDSKIIPSDSRLMKPTSVKTKCIPYSKALELQTLHSVSAVNVVADKATWVCVSGRFGLYSCDGEYVYRFNKSTFEFITYIVKDRLIPIKNKNFKILEETQMENNNVAAALAGLKNTMGNQTSAPTANLGSTAVFDGDLDKEKRKKENAAKREGLLNTLSSEIKDVGLSDTRQLKQFNSINATLIGWLTSRDKKVRSLVSTEKVRDKQTNKFVLKEGTPANIVKDFNNAVKIDPQYYATKSTLKFKQDAPGPIKVAVIKMPLVGLVPVDDLRKPGYTITIDPRQETDYIVHYVNKNDVPFFINAYIGKSINEDPRTHTEPSKLTVSTTLKTVTDPDTGLTQQVQKTSMKIDSKKPLVQEKNYFPATTYHTIPLSEAMNDPKTIELANISLFDNLFASTEKRPRSWDKLVGEDKELVKKEGEAIVSKFLDPKYSAPLNVVSFCDKMTTIVNPEIMLKKKVEKKDGSGEFRFVPDKFDILKDADSDINPLTSGRFDTFVQACEGTLTREKLVELLGRKAKGTSSSSNSLELTEEQTLQLYFKASDSGLSNIISNDKEFGTGKAEAIASEVFSVLTRAAK